jgi:nucleotide-binding universal stress UspA family protein
MQMLPIKRILCPTDFSEPSFVGLAGANELAAHFSAELILVHVVSPVHIYPSPQPGAGFNLAGYLEEMVDASRKSLEEVVKDRTLPDLHVRSSVLQGTPAEQIVNLAESEAVDLIVTATHGWTGWRRFIFGSVAEKVVRFATCPVVTVPAPEEEA